MKALEALADADVEGLQNTSLEIGVDGGGQQVWMNLRDVPGSLSLLRQIDKAARAADVNVGRRTSGSASIQLLTGRGDDRTQCTTDLQVARDADFRSAARTLIREGPDCLTLTTAPESKQPFTVSLDGQPADLDRVLELREEVRRLGGDVSRTDLSLSSIDLAIDDASALDGLIRLTLDATRWPVPARALLTLVWGQGEGEGYQTVIDGQPASVLQEARPLLVGLSRLGFLATVGVDREGKQTIGVGDEPESAPDLTTEAGQQALVQTIRESGFSGRRHFEVAVDGDPYALRFTSTATGEAKDVQEPTQSDGSWAYEIITAWNASAG